MSSIITFLGKGGTGRTTIAIATAKNLAAQGRKVLLLTEDTSPVYNIVLGIDMTAEPQEIAANLSVAQLSSTLLLEQNWEQVKKLEQQYLRSPIIKNVYGQELGVLPGMDRALALNKIREYDQSKQYDVIIYDGSGDNSTLRMFGIPYTLSWYIRRFRGVFQDSDIYKALAPFVQPVTSAVLNVSWSFDNWETKETNEANQMVEKGKQAMEEGRVISYLVTNDEPMAIAKAKYLWGSAQQEGLGVAGVLLNQAESNDTISGEFNPLKITSLPKIESGDWDTLGNALPTLIGNLDYPKPLTFNMSEKKISVFLPGFDKKQVKLTQNGSEITISAGDRRRNIDLPPAWSGRSVTGAKFTNNYLELTIG